MYLEMRCLIKFFKVPGRFWVDLVSGCVKDVVKVAHIRFQMNIGVNPIQKISRMARTT